MLLWFRPLNVITTVPLAPKQNYVVARTIYYFRGHRRLKVPLLKLQAPSSSALQAPPPLLLALKSLNDNPPAPLRFKPAHYP